MNTISPSAQQAQIESAINQDLRRRALERGPYLATSLEDNLLHLWIPSPQPHPRLRAEARRFNLKFDPGGGGSVAIWHRKVTPGKEEAALAWARRLYAECFGQDQPVDKPELAGQLG